MNCKKCGTEFKPKPARRVVCDKCIRERPVHLREMYRTLPARDARVKREPSSLVSVGYEPLTEAQLAAMVADFDRQWRERNVIPFPGRRVKPPTRPIQPFFGNDAA